MKPKLPVPAGWQATHWVDYGGGIVGWMRPAGAGWWDLRWSDDIEDGKLEPSHPWVRHVIGLRVDLWCADRIHRLTSCPRRLARGLPCA